jgi:hypothetical protein
MTIEVVDLRRGDRFNIVESLAGSFGAAEVAVLNLSLGGAQISHPQPLRIGTKAKLSFRRGDVSVTVQAAVVWSHLASTKAGMIYHTGIKLDAPDAQYALALNTLMRADVLRHETDSLEKKKQRMQEREEARKSQARMIPPSEPPPA